MPLVQRYTHKYKLCETEQYDIVRYLVSVLNPF